MQAEAPITAAVFASGTGSNAENILRFAARCPDRLHVPAVICNRPGAGVIARAEALGVPCHVFPVVRAAQDSFLAAKQAQEREICDFLERHGVQWVFLAGYMQILSPEFLSRFFDASLSVSRVVNIHPSLLPDFPGKDGYGDAWRAGVPRSGVTIHFVDGGVDTGPIIAQKSFERLPGDTLDDFRARGLRAEYEIYTDFLETLTREGPLKWAQR